MESFRGRECRVMNWDAMLEKKCPQMGDTQGNGSPHGENCTFTNLPVAD